MPRYFQAVAIDYDGTLTTSARPERDVLSAVAEARTSGLAVILVTGRIVDELLGGFPDAHDHFDLIVAENGGVLSWPDGSTRALAPALPAELAAALEADGVPARTGQVLVACAASGDTIALREQHRLGLDAQLVYNRAELMVLPAGVSKGNGLLEGLRELGLSYHNTIAIGDAENDHSLLEHAEVGVAVANAVDALKEHADLVLDEPDGRGVIGLLRGPVVAGSLALPPKRYQVELGRFEDGQTVRLAASQQNVLITGGSRSGKSYLAGLFAEELIRLRYAVLVVDPEGDHVALGRLPGLVVTGGDEPPPTPRHLAQILTHRYGSVAVDLSLLAPPERFRWIEEASTHIEAVRHAGGIPHWVLIDEAQASLAETGAARAAFDPSHRGYCLVSWQPSRLVPEVRESFDVVMALAGTSVGDDVIDVLARVADIPLERAAAELASAPPGHALLARRDRPGEMPAFAVRHRITTHVRHWHKYTSSTLPEYHRFHFCFGVGEGRTGRSAGNVAEFCDELGRCDAAVVIHHVLRCDFSRWISEVIQDDVLAERVRLVEEHFVEGTVDPEVVRANVLAAVKERYAT